MNNTIKLLQINKEDSDFQVKSDQINELIVKHKPQIIVINKLNLKNSDKILSKQFPNYNMETDNLDVVYMMSRTGILIHKDIHYKRCKELETMGISSVWIQLSHPGRKPLLIQGLYRQFHRLGRKGSNNPASQKSRWNKILEKWELANSEEKEIITLGDLHLNYLRWELQPEQMNSYDRQKKNMIEGLKSIILEKGHIILCSKPTKLSDNIYSQDSCLDLMISNRGEKISSFKGGVPSFSDHTLQILVRQTKPIQNTQTYVITRSYKILDRLQYKHNIRNHPIYIETLYEGQPNQNSSEYSNYHQ